MEQFLWDYEILSLMTSTVLILWLLVTNTRPQWETLSPKHKTIRSLLAVFFVLLFCTIGYGSFIEPYRVEITTTEINLNKTTKKEAIKLVLIADLHAGPYKKEAYFDRVAKKIDKIHPDLIVMAGDYIYNKESEAKEILPIQKVTNIYPTYAITGNHEYDLGSKKEYYKNGMHDKTGELKQILSKMNVTLLDNKGKLINNHGDIFYLSGIQEMWSQPDTINTILKNVGAHVTDTIPRILLAHNPDIILEKNADIFDLILSGHTHGGQIRLPLIGPILPIPDTLGRSFSQGLFSLKDETQLFITRGLGESGPRARLFCRPEISVIMLDL